MLLLFLQVAVGARSASKKLQLVFDVPATDFINDFDNFEDSGSLITHRKNYDPMSQTGKSNIKNCKRYRATQSLFEHLKQK